MLKKTVYYSLFMLCASSFIGTMQAQRQPSQYDDFLRSYMGKEYVQTIDSAKIRITYSLNYVQDSLNLKEVLKDRKVLLIGDKVNHFYSYYVRQQDSLLTADYAKRHDLLPIKRAPDILCEGYQIYSNHPNIGQQTVFELVTNLATYQYEETMELPQWTLSDETCTILNYSCQKATARFRGRDWEVWFSPDIPSDAGPWKLQGLPGLIMRAADTRKHYVFECIGVEQLKQKKEPIVQPIRFEYQHIKCSRQEYRKAQKQFYENYFQSVLALGWIIFIDDDAGNTIGKIEPLDESFYEQYGVVWGMGVSVAEMADRCKKIPYNPIELE
ncbi:hypothetical protein AGMMS4957_21580 [Bacteroidia bacterium]|nr:hypothetical protein AGMMS4957_21580 [Bacteroidia bacterium]